MLFLKRTRTPSMARLRTVATGAVILAVAKAVSIWIIAGACEQAGGEWWKAAAVAGLALAPAAALEAAALWSGYTFARRFLAGPSLDGAVQAGAQRLAHLLYACFFASSLGLFGAGWLLDLGLAVAAPVLAPLAPLAIAAGALKLLSSSVAQGARYEEESRNTI